MSEHQETPECDLGEIWDVLDSLPRSAPSPSETATTIEMVALSAQHRSVADSRPSSWAWLVAFTLVVFGFMVGITAGRATLPGPNGRTIVQTIAHSPLADHFDLLQEAGSVEFLHEVDRRSYPMPKWLPPLQLPSKKDQKFEAMIKDLQNVTWVDGQVRIPTETPIEDLSVQQRRDLEERQRDILRLDSNTRRQFMEVARVLANPANEHLIAAARLWHSWIMSRDPAERKSIVSLDMAERIEWLDRYSQRQVRMQSRPSSNQSKQQRRGFQYREENSSPPR